MHVKKQLELRTMALSLVLLLSLKMVQLTQNKSQLFKGLNVEHRKTFPFVNFNYLSSHYNLIRTAKLYSKEMLVNMIFLQWSTNHQPKKNKYTKSFGCLHFSTRQAKRGRMGRLGQWHSPEENHSSADEQA